MGMKNSSTPSFLLSSLVLALTACGGGGSDDALQPAADVSAAAGGTGMASIEAVKLKPKLPPSTSPAPTNPGATPADAARLAAATATAQSTTNLCAPIRPFYWEIGNGVGRAAAGSVLSTSSTTKFTSTMPMSIASASKWIYGAYVSQKTNGVLSAQDVKFLTFKSGYTNYSQCLQTQTVDQCLAYDGNGAYSATTDGAFYYNGGHMEKHASLNGLGGMNNAMLASTIMGQIGTDVKIAYSQPMLAGGIYTTPDSYAIFLRKILNKQLKMSGLLSANPVCTNKLTCPGQAIQAPIPLSESWHYSIGHWIEDDPVVGDGAFSSPGALGFYPWIDATRSYYGIVARSASQGGVPSMQCGRIIRKAWMTGIAQ